MDVGLVADSRLSNLCPPCLLSATSGGEQLQQILERGISQDRAGLPPSVGCRDMLLKCHRSVLWTMVSALRESCWLQSL